MKLHEVTFELDRIRNSPIFSKEMQTAAKVASYLIAELSHQKNFDTISGEDIRACLAYAETYIK